MPRASIVIPTRNRVALLGATIESAHAAGTDVEVVVVDDASTDGTPGYCAGLRGIRYVRLYANVGQGEARNRGIDAATADLVAFLDDDDLRLPGSLDLQLARLAGEPAAALCYGPLLVADPDGRLTGEVRGADPREGDLFWALLARNFVPTSSVVVRKACVAEVGPFRSVAVLPEPVEDWDLWLRLAERHPFVAVPAPVGVYRSWTPISGQLSSNAVRRWRGTLRVQAWGLALPRARAGDRALRRALRKRLVKRAVDGLLAEAFTPQPGGRLEGVLRALCFAARIRPVSVIRPRTLRRLLEARARARAAAGR